MLTTYGFIADNELIIQNIPKNPKILLNNFISDLYDSEIDCKTSQIEIVFNQKETPLKNFQLLNRSLKEVFFTKEISFKSLGKQVTVLPNCLNPELAYFLGYFLGDGGLKDIKKSFQKRGVYEYKIKIGDEFLVQVERIQKIIYELFKVNYPIRDERIHKGERLYYLEFNNKILYRYLVKVFGLYPGSKNISLEVPQLILDSTDSIKKWFLRGLFDADGDTRAAEKVKISQPRIKLRMKSKAFILKIKELLESSFNVSVNGPYEDKKWGSVYIQVERKNDIIKLNESFLFLHPIKKWRLNKICERYKSN